MIQFLKDSLLTQLNRPHQQAQDVNQSMDLCVLDVSQTRYRCDHHLRLIIRLSCEPS